MDPHIYPILMPISKKIDELHKRIAEVSVLPAETQTIDGKSDIYGLKATKAVMMKEVEMMRNDWLEAMESVYAVQDCLLSLCRMASPSNPNLIPPQNARVVFGLSVLLMRMKNELGLRIAEEKMDATNGIADVDGLISENTAMKAQLDAVGDKWLSMNAAFVAFVKYLVDIGLILAPTEESYPSQE